MATIMIMDPVTRVEGHMKVEVTIDKVNGQMRVVDARCAGTLFRGFEKLLAARDPWDAPVITQRICGVCPISHGQASVLALEDAAGWSPPTNARLLRNLTLGANFIQSHILHFYLLATLDYVRGPQVSPWVPAWEVDLRADPALEEVAEHLPLALEARRRAHEMGAILGGRMPSSHAYIPAGFTAEPTADRIDQFRKHLGWLLGFIRTTYISDVRALAGVYPEYRSIGEGCKNLLAYGVFELDNQGRNKLFRPGYVIDGASEPRNDIEDGDITEAVSHSWYRDATSNRTPSEGLTKPIYPKTDAYSWLKAPRLSEEPFEVGPLARMWVNGDYQQGISVMHRHLARAREALKIGKAMEGWLDELRVGGRVYRGYPELHSGVGVGMTEAPRGALGHWVAVSRRKIEHYQIITPTCWNASPRDDDGVPGPMEQALLGTPVRRRTKPIEVLRVIHSFDPCLSCAVHVMQPKGEPIVLRAGVN